MATPQNNRRLVLHFDINNTILMADKAKGIGCVENVNPTPLKLNSTFRSTVLCASLLGVACPAPVKR